ncbi:MAG: T9SS type A sorting domain-containing protein [Chitinivibrionales bacterium]|nr:T9SS type A sorting domain-containing protein [Chitinivibrionales bacterium]
MCFFTNDGNALLSVALFNARGRKVWSAKVKKSTSLKLSPLSAGTYLIRADGLFGSIVRKLVITGN